MTVKMDRRHFESLCSYVEQKVLDYVEDLEEAKSAEEIDEMSRSQLFEDFLEKWKTRLATAKEKGTAI